METPKSTLHFHVQKTSPKVVAAKAPPKNLCPQSGPWIFLHVGALPHRFLQHPVFIRIFRGGRVKVT